MADSDRGPARAEGTVALDQPFDSDALYSLRAAVAAHAADLGAGEELVEELVVVANELASNAVRHGGGTGRLRLWRAGDLIRCEVSDAGPGLADGEAGHEPVPVTAYGGRGLWVVRQMSDEVDVRTSPAGATVTAAFVVRS
ncbi:ATP-binding protein [Phytohabitans sp. ZYX-F-186]|uniref:ATP-binding protein n=1 Tax=Phytohabitans maris TaxID=3071409 RepID=A0ABU0ZUI0_9ACTN|nr:ATP-binding protein [Phytohabitans sp. ZYX-F-186]MDQ7910698.1 ATP-binding protein [Phytohabitans sp. ZYX-F-186]